MIYILLLLITSIRICLAAPFLPMKVVSDSPRFDEVGYNQCDMKVNGELIVLQKFIKHGDTVFDVGANCGEWSENVLVHHKGVAIFAFEPIPELCKQLEIKFYQKPVSIAQCALSSQNGMCDFNSFEGTNSGVSGIYDRPGIANLAHAKIKIETIKLDDFCKNRGIDHINFLKIDTEGSEWDVLCGAKELLSRHAIDAIQFEYGGTYPDAKIALKMVYEFLTGLGYELYRISPHYLICVGTWRDELENYRYANYLALIKR